MKEAHTLVVLFIPLSVPLDHPCPSAWPLVGKERAPCQSHAPWISVSVVPTHQFLLAHFLVLELAVSFLVSHSLWIIGTTSYSSFLCFLRGGGSELGVLRLFHIVSDNS